MAQTVDWVSIIRQAGISKVRQFATGTLSGRNFSNTCTDARRVVDALGAAHARRLAKNAVYRYNQRTAAVV